MLQSRLNGGNAPAVYLCPDNFLIAQTCDQAKQFGISTCVADPALPDEFLNGDRILVTSVQKLFNGLTKFGLNRQSIPIDSLLSWMTHTPAPILFASNAASGYRATSRHTRRSGRCSLRTWRRRASALSPTSATTSAMPSCPFHTGRG